MSHETHDSDVLDALRRSLDGVTSHTDVETVVATGRARRRRHRTLGAATGALAAGGLALATALTNPATAPPGAHVDSVAFTVRSQSDGSVVVSWDKRRYFEDHAGVERALRQAGFPVTITEGTFCLGPDDDPSLDASGLGPGAREVLTGRTGSGRGDAQRAPGTVEPGTGKGTSGGKGEQVDRVSLTFHRDAIPAGKQLFIAFLTPAQLEVTDGHPGSVERLVSASGPLTCTTDLPHTGS